MGIKRTPKLSAEPKPKKEKVPKAPKKLTCQECPNFPFHKDIDYGTDYYRESSVGKGTIAFIMSPIDFYNLDKKQWKYAIYSGLMDYNILLLPYPQCVENVLQPDKPKVALLRACKDNFILKYLKSFSVDLVVVFDETKIIMTVDDNKDIDFCGNWETWSPGDLPPTRVYFAKSLYNPNTGGFWNENFQHTVRKINKFFNKELIWQGTPDFKTVTTIEQLDAVIKEVEQQDLVAIDVETSGLDVLAKDFRLKTIGVGWGKSAVCIGYEVEECLDLKYQARVRGFIVSLLSNKDITKVCHHLKFEEKVFIRKFNFHDFENCEDTMFLSYLFNEKRQSNGLKYLAGEYCDGYDKVVKDFADARLSDLWFYNCLDCFFTGYLKIVTFDFAQLNTLKDGIQYVYKEVMLPECYEIARMELDGVPVDFDYLEKLKCVLMDEVEELKIKIEHDFPAVKEARLKKEEETKGKEQKSYISPKQLAHVLFDILKFPIIKQPKPSAKAKVAPTPSVDKEVLVTLKELHGCKLAEYLLELRKKEKQLSTYVIPYIEDRPNMVDGHVRSSYSQVKSYDAAEGQAKGTVTGRLSSAGPNLQNISRDKTIKKIFIPSQKEKGRLFIQSDLSQAELRIAASLAFEDKMLQVYREDGDLHTRTGLLIVPKVLYDKFTTSVGNQETIQSMLRIGKPNNVGDKKLLGDIRQNGKPGNFGMIYGGTWAVLQRIAKQNYCLDLSKEDAMHAHAAFFTEYKNLEAWHEETHAFIAKYGMSVSPMGRVRRVPEVFVYPVDSEQYSAALREALNSIVQGVCADFLGQVWVRGMREVRRRKLANVVRLSVHDSIVGDCLNKDVGLEVAHIMGDATKYWTEFHSQYWLQCPMKMDSSIGEHWGALKELGE
jgi:DNA polymerase I